MTDLQTWVGQVAGMMADNDSDLEYPGDYALVTEYGQPFAPPESIDANERRMAEYGVEPGDLKNCYENSGQVVVFDGTPGLFYVEGFAFSDNGFPVSHAWLTTISGQVVDPTWGQHDAQITEADRNPDDRPHDSEPGIEYFGVPFTNAAVTGSAMNNEVWGVFGVWNADFWRDGIPSSSIARLLTDLTSVARSDTIEVSGE